MWVIRNKQGVVLKDWSNHIVFFKYPQQAMKYIRLFCRDSPYLKPSRWLKKGCPVVPSVKPQALDKHRDELYKGVRQ